MPVKIPTVQTGLEASIQSAAKKAGRNLKINMGGNAKSIEGLSQPLGRITGKADQFTKSMEAANARVLAFGASVGILAAVTRGFKELVLTTIEVEKSLISINSILGTNAKELEGFSKTIFNVARNTEQSFNTVATAALELSRQGLNATEVQKRLGDSMILTRVSGLGATEAVSGLTAAINSFNKSGLSSSVILNKLSAAAVAAAVSERDLIEGIKRAGSVASLAGVSFDELVGVITAVQVKTARGGAVIGNSFKTIFTRIQSIEKLETMQNLGVQVTDASGKVLGATKLIQNLSKVLSELPEAKRLQIAEGLVGKFQISPFLALLDDYNSKTSIAINLTKVSQNATKEAYERNLALNEALSAAINVATLNVKELADTLGRIGVTDNLQNLLGFFNTLVENVKGVLDGEGAGGDFARGIVKGIGAVISGPGLAIFGAIIIKLGIDLAKFGLGSLKTFFGLNQAAREQATLQGQIASTLLGNKSIQEKILSIENSSLSAEKKKVEQTKFFTTAIKEQLAVMTQMQGIAMKVAPGVAVATRPVARRAGKGRAAGGFIPNYNAIAGYGSESSDISKGVGGAPTSAKPVTIPNFNFGGGQKGSMVANSSEYIVPNYAGSGGSAIFNQDMVSSMGMPAGARKISAAGGYIPNFAEAVDPKVPAVNAMGKYVLLLGQKGKTNPQQKAYLHPDGKFNITKGTGATEIRVPTYGLSENHKGRDIDEYIKEIEEYSIEQAIKQSAEISDKQMPRPLVQSAIKAKVNRGSLSAFAGSIYELTLASLLTDKEFLAYASQTDTSNFDLNLKGQEDLLELYGIETKPSFGEVKGRKNPDNIASAAAKIHRVSVGNQSAQKSKLIGKKLSHDDAIKLGFKKANSRRGRYIIKSSDLPAINKSGKQFKTLGDVVSINAASGYIPNFANPLEDAVGREQAAGLPINQIRVNQSPKLRNAGNPMGLAVTNTRDEPTGAIPNFAKSNIGMSDIGVTSKFTAAAKSLGQLNTTIDSLNKQLKKGKITRSGAEVELKKLTSAIKTNGSVRKKINDVGLKKLNTDSKVEKGNRDFLGTIFAVQAGMTALSGATEGAESTTAQLINSFSSAAASGATTTFALKGVGDFLESSGGKLGKFGGSLSKASGYIGAAVAGIQLAGDIFDRFSGITDFAADGMARVAQSAKDAAFRLDEFDPLEQRNIKNDADFFLNSIKERTAEEGTLLGSIGTFFKQGGNIGSTLDFEGFDMFGAGALEETLDAAILAAVAGSADPKQVQAQLSKIALDRDITKEEVRETQDLFDKLTQDAKKLNKELKTLTDKGIIGEEDLKFIQQFNSKEEFQKAINSSDADAIRVKKNMGVTGVGEVKDKTMGEIFDAAKLKQASDLAIEKENILKKERITNTLAKQRVTTAIGMAKLEKTHLNTLELQFMEADKMGTLSNDRRRDATLDILNAKKNFDLRNATLDTMEKISEKSESLSKIEGINTTALAEIQRLSEKRNITEQDRVKALEAAKLLLEEDTGAVKASIEPLLVQLGLTEATLEKTRLRALAEADINKLIAERNDRLDAEATVNKTLLSTTKNAKLRRLQGDKKEVQDRISLRSGTPRSNREEKQNATEIAKERRTLAGIDTKIKIESTAASQRSEARTLATAASKRFGKGIDGDGLAEFNKEISTLSGGKLISKFQEIIKTTKALGFGVDEKTSEKFFKDNPDTLIADMEAFVRTSKETNKKDKLENKTTIDTADNDINISTRPAEKSFRQLLDNMQEQLGNTENLAQARIDNSISTDPVQRLKFKFNEKNREDRITALDPDNPNLELFRELTEENEFAGKLIDASAQFAHNIGDAMTEAIIQGGNLGDILIGTATSFFTTLSKAYMTRAVDSVIGKFASGGKVTGGSGNRDDVPALLTGGEFVMKKSSVSKYGSSFMESLNAGSIPAMARGGLFTPGTNGQEEIKGKSNLIDFATQSFTTGASDRFGSGAGSASVNLEPQSAALTMFGRRNSPAFKREQDSKRDAFGLFTQQVQKEEEAREQKRQAKKDLKNAIIGAVVSAGFSSLATKFSKPNVDAVPDYALMLGGGSAAPIGGRSSSSPMTISTLSQSLTDNTDFIKMMDNLDKVNLAEGYTGMLPPRDTRGRYATGGSVPNAAGVDTVPSMLSGGEFVMNAAATQKIGAGNLNALNSGAGGGSEDIVSKLDELISVSDNAGETVINITVNSDGSSDTQGGGGDGGGEQQRSLATRIKDVVKQVIDDEKRLGGSLRQARA